ncbi:MAG TPA: carbohydrate binding domain-containing protein [Pyrinomonadaceae bacterium]|nr:carbohydrate binding domain-containing protein [Pyrinomonadaceae bacterium]
MARIALALIATGACLLLMRDAARIGFSRLLTRYALITNSLPAADQAVQITPADPEAHRARALILNRLHRPAEAEASLETATSLRDGPEDLWIELGNTREELGDREGALAAFDRAVRSAPYYAHTHWQRGNLLLRMGRYDEAFADLREAAARNRKYFPNLLDLAWGLTGDARKTEALLQLQDDNDRLAFARFLASKGRATDVVDQVRLLSAPLSDENKDELVRLLSASKRFNEAFELWRGRKPEEGIVNGSFEEPLVLNKVVFQWSLLQGQPKVKLAVDVYERARGARSLQIAFDGESDPGATLLWQTILIEPGRRYQLKFFVKTKDLVTGGPPRIVLTDAMNDRIIAKSEPFPSGSGEWSEMNVEFTAPSQSVVINLIRDNCASTPCPIFGVVWLDDFSLQKL